MAKTGPKPSFDVKELFDYKDGLLLWKQSKRGGRRAGREVGYGGNNNGYKWTKIDGRYFLVHRLVYLFHTGEWPDLIDHIDCNKTNNCIENLRASNKSQNACNLKKLLSNNTSGFTGVYWSANAKKWIAQYTRNKNRYYVGLYDSPVVASQSLQNHLKENQSVDQPD